MSKKYKFEYPLVLIEWQDAFMDNFHWQGSREALNSVEDCTTYTAGFLGAEDNDSVKIVQTLISGDFASAIQIPKRMIVKISQLRKPMVKVINAN
jgi:hypothetical protein